MVGWEDLIGISQQTISYGPCKDLVGTEPHRSKGVATVGASPQIDVGGATAGVALRQEVKQEEQKEGGGATSGVALLNS